MQLERFETMMSKLTSALVAGLLLSVFSAQAQTDATATGPGSLGTRDALSPAGQMGFNASVTLHLSRNYKRTPTGALASRSICDAARDARARNSPAAPGLEAQCRAPIAATGEAIAKLDPIVAAARTAESDALYRQGFDIATGIFGDPAQGARGSTAMGPGSLGIRDALSAAGQRGFNAAVTLHLSRNYKKP